MAAAADPPHYYAFDNVSRSGSLVPCAIRGTEVILFAEIALYHYNQSNDADFEFLKVDHGNGQFIGGALRYITFMGMNSAQSIQMFQCIVWRSINGENGEIILEVELCRVKPSCPSEDPESNSPQEKRQKPETTEEIEGEQVDSEEEIDAALLDEKHMLATQYSVTYIDDFLKYRSQVETSKGFDVPNLPQMFVGQITQLDPSECCQRVFGIFAELVLYDYARRQPTELPGIIPMEFEKIEWVNVQTNLRASVTRPLKAKNANFYITFTAKYKSDGSLVALQTVVSRRIDENGYLQIVASAATLAPTFRSNHG